ncbi:MAG: hypothetical protein HYZ46_08800 [Nitrosomonadales bacterium]|nr:hypothetical protein [Nitrosomonadales bacterium]
MSQSQCDATALLCRLLDSAKPVINGLTLCSGEHANAGQQLLHERVLVISTPLDWVTCAECGIETARVVRELAHDQILLLCPACGEVSAQRRLRDTFKPSLPKLITALQLGIGLSPTGAKPIEPEICWRLGTTEPTRGKPVTWYFARHLHQPKVAQHLREQIKLDKAVQSCRIITCSELPLPDGSPLTGLDVANLATLARISQSKFEFFADRLAAPGPQVPEEATPGTSLKYVDAQTKVYIDGQPYDLEPRHRSILLALMNDLDHEMDKDALKSACGSEAQRFSPSKAFDRIPVVYRTFIRYLPDDERYALIIPEEDQHWLH